MFYKRFIVISGFSFCQEHKFNSCLSLLHNHTIDTEIQLNKRPREEIAQRYLYSLGALFVVCPGL